MIFFFLCFYFDWLISGTKSHYGSVRGAERAFCLMTPNSLNLRKIKSTLYEYIYLLLLTFADNLYIIYASFNKDFQKS